MSLFSSREQPNRQTHTIPGPLFLAVAVTGLPQELASEVLRLTMGQPGPGWRLAGALLMLIKQQEQLKLSPACRPSNTSEPLQACVAQLAHPQQTWAAEHTSRLQRLQVACAAACRHN